MTIYQDKKEEFQMTDNTNNTVDDILSNDSKESDRDNSGFSVAENPIGHITAQESPVTITRTGSEIKGFLYANDRSEVSVRDYVRIPQYSPGNDMSTVSEILIASVDGLSYISSEGIRDLNINSSGSFDGSTYKAVCSLDPISVVNNSDGDIASKSVTHPPRPTAEISKVKSNAVLREGLDIPDDGVYIGDMAVNGTRVPSKDNPLEYFMQNPNASDDTSKNGESMLFRHTLVAGSTGTGKTHTSKNILRQFAKCKKYKISSKKERRLNLTIIDPEEEYTEMGSDPRNIDKVKQISNNRIGLEYGGLNRSDIRTEFQSFVPVISDNISVPDAPGGIREFGIPFKIVDSHRQLMMSNDPEEPTRDGINQILKDFFTDSSSANTYSAFYKWADSQRDYYKSRLGDMIADAAMRRLLKSRYRRIFDSGSTDLLDITDEMFNPGQVSVITTGHLTGRIEKFIIQTLLSHIVDNKIKSGVEYKIIKNTPMVLALDEAHKYLTNPETTRERYIVSKFRTAARRGRKDLFGLYFISQNPKDIDGDVRNQLNTKIYLRLEQRVAELGDVYVPDSYKDKIANFKPGQMVVRQPNVRDVELVGLSETLTRHSN